MTVSERSVGSITMVDVKGAITLTDGATLLADKVRSLIQQDRKQIVVNLADVPFMDSAGLGELVQSYATTSRQGGALKLVNTTKRLHDLLVITKLANVFELFDSEAAAVASFGATV